MALIMIPSGNQLGNYYPLGHRTDVIGHTELMFTAQDLDDAQNVLLYFRKVEERSRPMFRGEL